MEQSPSREVNRFAASKIPRTLRKQHFQVPADCPYPKPAQSSPYFLKIQINVILPSTSGSPQWYLSLKFPHQNSVHASPISHTRYMPRQSHSSRFYHPHNTG
jgi:hypothetical protein